MFKRINLVIAAVVLAAVLAVVLLTIGSDETTNASISTATYTNVGRSATEQEIAAWDIDVRPDFKGLPAGSGSVEAGEEVWEAKCASCHGTFGESNEVFTPMIGGTTTEDVASGRVAALVGDGQPQKTTIMKVATLSTLWDYIHRAMPWTAPKTLSDDEVYAVTAYILYLAEIIPDDFTLTNENIEEVQKLMPNRSGMTLEHGLRQVNGKPDVKSEACMSNCKTQDKLASEFPDSARNAHGNIQLQNRTFGAVRGVNTTMPPAQSLDESVSRQEALALGKPEKVNTVKVDMLALAKKNNCLSCHGTKNKIVGPGFNEISAKYKADEAAGAALEKKVKNGTSGVWGDIPMPAQTAVNDSDIRALVNWILKEN